MREIVTLACGDCKRRNYSTTKNRRKSSERLEFSKFCRSAGSTRRTRKVSRHRAIGLTIDHCERDGLR